MSFLPPLKANLPVVSTPKPSKHMRSLSSNTDKQRLDLSPKNNLHYNNFQLIKLLDKAKFPVYLAYSPANDENGRHRSPGERNCLDPARPATGRVARIRPETRDDAIAGAPPTDRLRWRRHRKPDIPFASHRTAGETVVHSDDFPTSR